MPERSEVDIPGLLSDLVPVALAWQGGGVLSQSALKAIVRDSPSPIRHSIETGCGLSTILLSNLSLDHTVFTIRDHTLEAAIGSPHLRKTSVTVVEGPSQLTMPEFRFDQQLDLALLDGPHAFPYPNLEYYYVYPHLAPGALLVLDDIHIPTVNQLFHFVREDKMFELVEVTDTTAFLRRTLAPAFPTDEDGWWTQSYNLSRFPLSGWPAWGRFRPRVRNLAPLGARRSLKWVLPQRLRQWMLR